MGRRKRAAFVESKHQYVVEEILAHKFDREFKEMVYLVRWYGFTSADNTWEPTQSFIGAQEILYDYVLKHGKIGEHHKILEIRAEKKLQEDKPRRGRPSKGTIRTKPGTSTSKPSTSRQVPKVRKNTARTSSSEPRRKRKRYYLEDEDEDDDEAEQEAEEEEKEEGEGEEEEKEHVEEEEEEEEKEKDEEEEEEEAEPQPLVPAVPAVSSVKSPSTTANLQFEPADEGFNRAVFQLSENFGAADDDVMSEQMDTSIITAAASAIIGQSEIAVPMNMQDNCLEEEAEEDEDDEVEEDDDEDEAKDKPEPKKVEPRKEDQLKKKDDSEADSEDDSEDDDDNDCGAELVNKEIAHPVDDIKPKTEAKAKDPQCKAEVDSEEEDDGDEKPVPGSSKDVKLSFKIDEPKCEIETDTKVADDSKHSNNEVRIEPAAEQPDLDQVNEAEAEAENNAVEAHFAGSVGHEYDLYTDFVGADFEGPEFGPSVSSAYLEECQIQYPPAGAELDTGVIADDESDHDTDEEDVEDDEDSSDNETGQKNGKVEAAVTPPVTVSCGAADFEQNEEKKPEEKTQCEPADAEEEVVMPDTDVASDGESGKPEPATSGEPGPSTSDAEDDSQQPTSEKVDTLPLFKDLYEIFPYQEVNERIDIKDVPMLTDGVEHTVHPPEGNLPEQTIMDLPDIKIEPVSPPPDTSLDLYEYLGMHSPDNMELETIGASRLSRPYKLGEPQQRLIKFIDKQSFMTHSRREASQSAAMREGHGTAIVVQRGRPPPEPAIVQPAPMTQFLRQRNGELIDKYFNKPTPQRQQVPVQFPQNPLHPPQQAWTGQFLETERPYMYSEPMMQPQPSYYAQPSWPVYQQPCQIYSGPVFNDVMFYPNTNYSYMAQPTLQPQYIPQHTQANQSQSQQQQLQQQQLQQQQIHQQHLQHLQQHHLQHPPHQCPPHPHQQHLAQQQMHHMQQQQMQHQMQQHMQQQHQMQQQRQMQPQIQQHQMQPQMQHQLPPQHLHAQPPTQQAQQQQAQQQQAQQQQAQPQQHAQQHVPPQLQGPSPSPPHPQDPIQHALLMSESSSCDCDSPTYVDLC